MSSVCGLALYKGLKRIGKFLEWMLVGIERNWLDYISMNWKRIWFQTAGPFPKILKTIWFKQIVIFKFCKGLKENALG